MGHCRLDWGIAARPLPGEELSGDQYFVARTGTGWLLAVADGLGHGPKAALAGTALIDVLRERNEQSPAALIRLCHEALKATRGCAAVIAAIDEREHLLNWVGIGNVEGVLRHDRTTDQPSDYITMRGGIIGYRIPAAIQPASLRLTDGDLLVLATDGIDNAFAQAELPAFPPLQLAKYILHRYAKSADDALVLVGRWHAPNPPLEEHAT